MRSLTRSIEEVRRLRGDLSTYLIHLTRKGFLQQNGTYVHYTAKDSLKHILSADAISPLKPVGQFSHRSYSKIVQPQDLHAVCLTETPLEQIYLFMGIEKRALDFQSYGLVFESEQLSKAPIRAAPVMYFSQPTGSDFHFVNQMANLVTQHYSTYKDILYLFDRFGKYQTRDQHGQMIDVDYNFRWEREWRIKGSFSRVKSFVKFGLCPENDIDEFEASYQGIKFVDPFFHPQQIRAILSSKGVSI